MALATGGGISFGTLSDLVRGVFSLRSHCVLQRVQRMVVGALESGGSFCFSKRCGVTWLFRVESDHRRLSFRSTASGATDSCILLGLWVVRGQCCRGGHYFIFQGVRLA